MGVPGWAPPLGRCSRTREHLPKIEEKKKASKHRIPLAPVKGRGGLYENPRPSERAGGVEGAPLTVTAEPRTFSLFIFFVDANVREKIIFTIRNLEGS